MSAQQLVMEGLLLMVIGMGTVFVFLTILVLTTQAMSRLLAYLPEEAPPALATVAPVTPPTGGIADDTLVAVISAALHRHRGRSSSGAGKRRN